jgi:RecA-family ATPase
MNTQPQTQDYPKEEVASSLVDESKLKVIAGSQTARKNLKSQEKSAEKEFETDGEQSTNFQRGRNRQLNEPQFQSFNIQSKRL